MKTTRWLVSILMVPFLLTVLTASANVGGIQSGGLTGNRFPISHEAKTAGGPKVAYSPDRREYLVVWFQAASNWAIRAQRVAASGSLVGDPFNIVAGLSTSGEADVTYNTKRREYLVVWHRNTGGMDEVHVQPVAAGGGNKGADITVASLLGLVQELYVAYSSASDKYLVVWQQTLSGPGSRIGASALNSDGSASGYASAIHDVSLPYVRCDVAYNRSRNEFLVVWYDTGASGDDDIFGRRVQGNGTPMHPDRITIASRPGDQTSPMVAALPTEPDKGQYLVVWEDAACPLCQYDIWGQRVSGQGIPEGGSFPITDDPDLEYAPDVATSEKDHQYLVVSVRKLKSGEEVATARKVAFEGFVLGHEVWIGGVVRRPRVANGPGSEFLIANEDIMPPDNREHIFGQMWGNFRVYLPFVLR